MLKFLKLLLTVSLLAASMRSAFASPLVTRACNAPPLPAPTSNVVQVSTESALQNAVKSVTSDGTIVIQPGTYNLTSTLYFNRNIDNVTIRGSTDACDDVILVGNGMTVQGNTPYGIWVGGPTNMTIADLTIKSIYYHPIMLETNYGTQSPHVYNVHLIDAGEQFVKVPQPGTAQYPPAGTGIANGMVEYSIIEYTTYKDPAGPAGPTYTNGVDITTTSNWIIRNNLFRNIRAAPGQGIAGPTLLAWKGATGTIADGNLFLNCQRGISFGIDDTRSDDHIGGIVRNNIFDRTSSQSGDVGIYLANSANTKILNNTVVLSGTYPNAIEYRFSGTIGAEIRYNLNDGAVQLRDGASGTVANNVTNAQSSWFVSAAAGDLHLVSTATAAIDKAAVHPEVPLDYDLDIRPQGPAPDIGADEFASTLVPPTAPTNLQVQ